MTGTQFIAAFVGFGILLMVLVTVIETYFELKPPKHKYKPNSDLEGLQSYIMKCGCTYMRNERGIFVCTFKCSTDRIRRIK